MLLQRRALALVAAVTLVAPLALVTMAQPAAATSAPTAPGTPSAIALNGAAALQWTAPSDVGSPALTQYRVEANNGSGWSQLSNPQHSHGLASGDRFTCALLHAGTVKCWGDNAYGQLGVGDTAHRGDNGNEMGTSLTAVNLGTGRTATAIAAGDFYACALLDNATVKCWGRNIFGQLGQGDTSSRGDNPNETGDNLPAIDLGTGRTATAIAAGDDQTCAILDNGDLKCWGHNTSGDLGLGDTAARGDGAGEMGDSLPAIDLGTGRTATAIALGSARVCALLDNGTVKCWGNNSAGQLGQGDTQNRGDNANEMGANLPPINLGTGRTAKAIDAGGDHTCAILDNSTLKCWGFNLAGQLGLGDTIYRGDNPGEMGDALPTVDLGTGRTPVALALGGLRTCVLLDFGDVKCWGNGAFGQLGVGDTSYRGDNTSEMGNFLPTVDLGTNRSAVALSGGGNHECAVLDNDAIKCWGYNAFGQLGQGNTASRGDGVGALGDGLRDVDIGDRHATVAVTGGSDFTCAIVDDGSVRCWGGNGSGQLGADDTIYRGLGPGQMAENLTPVDLGTGRTAVALSAGYTFVCALLDNATVKCWGSDAEGELGQGDTVMRGDEPNEMGDNLPAIDLGTGRTATAIDTGDNFACALLDNASVKCWGRNVEGELGQGDTQDRGDNANEMGDNLPAIDLGTGRTAVKISVASDHACAVLDDATVKCWGINGFGELGLGDTARRGDNPSEMGDNLPAVDLGTGRTATAIAAGGDHTCAILDDATTKCWGGNGTGQLGLGDTANRGDGPSEMGNSLPTVNVGTGRTSAKISVNSAHTCAVLDNASVKCWGWNLYGQLGQGDTASRGDGPSEMGNSLVAIGLGTGRTATAIATGNTHSCAVLDSGELKCWGRGIFGNLGLGDNTDRGDGAGEMGDSLPAVAITDPVGSVPATTAIVRLPANTYTFRIVALNSTGESTPSPASAPVVVTSTDAPDAPTGVSGLSGNGQVTVSWAAPGNIGGSALIDYTVSVFNDAGGSATGVTGAATRSVGSVATVYTFTGLTNGTAYTFKVAAVNDAGIGAQSALSTPAYAASFNVPAQIPNPGTTGSDSGYVVNNSVTVSAAGSWCPNSNPIDCVGPVGDAGVTVTPTFLYPTAGTAYALVGRIGTTGPWALIGAGPTTLNGNGKLYLAMNDQAGSFNDNSGTLQASVATLDGVSGVTPPVSAQLTSGYDAAWSIPIINESNATLTGVSATLHAHANGPVPLLFHDAIMPGCVAGGGNSEVCTLANIPAHSTYLLNVYVPTTGLLNGRTVSGDVAVSAAGGVNASGTLGAATIVNCGTACVKAVAPPGVPVSSSANPPATPASPPQQVVTLPATQTGATPEPVAVTLSTITPSPSISASDKKLCPVAAGQTHCSGKISSFVANFSAYNDAAHPIRVRIVTNWGSAVPPGRILMEKDTGGDPLFLLGCVQDATTHKYNVPCALPETRTGSSGAGNLTTTNIILFTGFDIHFARRESTGGTVIKAPAAPTAVTVVPGATKATLKWKAPTVTNGAGVTSYVVTVLSAGQVVKTVTYPSPALTQSVAGLINGRAYTFKVAAKNVAGASAPAPATAAIVVGAPAAPTGVTAARVASGSIRVAFVAPTVNNGAPITGYTATCTSTNAGVTKTKVGTMSPLVVTALTPGKSYKCTVKATNSRGAGPPSAAAGPVNA